ncbi:hypothetical protein ACPF8X_46790, partial [Streptomyces sp. G35A]
TAGLGQAELARLRRGGVGALSTRQALAVLEAALNAAPAPAPASASVSGSGPEWGWAHVVPVKLELAGVRGGAEEVPALLRHLVR